MSTIYGGTVQGTPLLRADARRNREQLLSAACDVFVEQGPDAPLEEIARRAGVGIATLYRRFPDRQALQQAVALDVITRSAAAAQAALAEETTGFDALVRYMHAALDMRVSAVMPLLFRHVTNEDDTLQRARDASTSALHTILARAQAEGSIRSDIVFGDIGTILVRLGRPLPGDFTPDLNMRLAHRHLELFLDGMRALPRLAADALPDPAMSLADIRALREQSGERAGARGEERGNDGYDADT